MPNLDGILLELSNLLEVDPELMSEEDQLAFNAYVQELEEDLAGKVDRGVSWMIMETARISAIREEANRLAKKARTMEKNISRLREAWTYVLERRGKKKVQGTIYSVALRRTKAVEILPGADIPEEFLVRKVEETPDKMALRKAIEAGRVIDGVSIRERNSLAVK